MDDNDSLDEVGWSWLEIIPVFLCRGLEPTSFGIVVGWVRVCRTTKMTTTRTTARPDPRPSTPTRFVP
jgi:hypothetical protein